MKDSMMKMPWSWKDYYITVGWNSQRKQTSKKER